MSDSGPEATRHSDVVYVLVKLRACGKDYLLLNAHRKWGDWSLVGGHIESEDPDPRSAAAREVREEMAPLRNGAGVEVELLDPPNVTEWGPVPSRSAGGKPTRYSARWYVLRFREDPAQLLAALSPQEFRLVDLTAIPKDRTVSAVVERASQLLPGGLDALPLSWDRDLGDSLVVDLAAKYRELRCIGEPGSEDMCATWRAGDEFDEALSIDSTPPVWLCGKVVQ